MASFKLPPSTNPTTAASTMANLVLTAYDPSKSEVVSRKKKNVTLYFSKFQERNRNMANAKKILLTLTHGELSLFFSMDDLKDPTTNEVEFSRALCASETVNYYKQLVAGLIAKNMIIRIKQNHYLMTPNVFIPPDEYFHAILSKWYSLGGKLPGTIK